MEAITREEKLLDGQELEPITRKEMFIKRIYDKTQYIPEPITREEYFLKKAGEGSGDITIEQLTVTENGEYSESGKAYSPVIVEVPVSQSYLVKDVPNLPQSIATIDDAIVAPIIKLKADIEAVQSGSGDPSPSNIRPISGWDGANVWVQAEVDPTAEADYSISWQTQCGTVYGGSIDVVSGVLTVDVKKLDNAKNLSWVATNTAGVFYASISDKKVGYSSWVISPEYSYYNGYFSGMGNNQLASNSSYKFVYIKNTNCSTVDELKEALAGVPFYYITNDVQTYQLSPTQVNSFLADNNIFADCGDIEECRYVTGVL